MGAGRCIRRGAGVLRRDGLLYFNSTHAVVLVRRRKMVVVDEPAGSSRPLLLLFYASVRRFSPI